MPISCIYGLPGKGKTQFSLYYAIYLCNKYSKNLVSNFSINIPQLFEYCKLMGYSDFLTRLCIPHSPCVFYANMESEDILDNILTIPNSIIIIDESGAYIRARGSTSATPKKFLKDLTQVRHRRQYCLFISQSEKQIDSAIKVLADEIIYCDGISIYDAVIDAPRLQLKIVRRFTPDKYEIFASDPRVRGNPLKAYLAANKNWLGIPTVADSFLFSIYDSFGLVHDDKILNNQEGNQFKNSTKLPFRNRMLTDADISGLRGHTGGLPLASAIPQCCFTAYNPIFTSTKISNKVITLLFKNFPADALPLYYNLKRLFFKKPIYFNKNNSLHKFTLWLLFGFAFVLLLNLFSILTLLI